MILSCASALDAAWEGDEELSILVIGAGDAFAIGGVSGEPASYEEREERVIAIGGKDVAAALGVGRERLKGHEDARELNELGLSVGIARGEEAGEARRHELEEGLRLEVCQFVQKSGAQEGLV